MPSLMSYEDRALEAGDAFRCKYCSEVFSVDESHCCSEMTKASRAANKKFHKDFFGDETLRTRQFIITIVCPDTDMAFNDAWDSIGAWGPEQTEGSDDILKTAWQIEEIK